LFVLGEKKRIYNMDIEDIETETELETAEMTTETTTGITTERITTPPGEYTLNNSGSFDWIFVYYFIVIILLFGGLLFLRKYLIKNANKLGGVKSGNYMKILDRLAVSQDKQIILIEAGNKILLIGASAQRVETLAEYSKEEFGNIINDIEENDAGGSRGTGTFGGNFLSLLGKKLNIKDSGKNDK